MNKTEAFRANGQDVTMTAIMPPDVTMSSVASIRKGFNTMATANGSSNNDNDVTLQQQGPQAPTPAVPEHNGDLAAKANMAAASMQGIQGIRINPHEGAMGTAMRQMSETTTEAVNAISGFLGGPKSDTPDAPSPVQPQSQNRAAFGFA